MDIKKSRKSLERQLQITVYQWFWYKYPQYRLSCFHTPNGGKRDIREAALFKKMGVLAGVPDLVLLIPKMCYHGLAVELKLPGEKLNKNQIEVMKQWRKMGYKVEVEYEYLSATQTIEDYLNE